MSLTLASKVKQTKAVLVVCSGNLFRSPVAAALLGQVVKRNQLGEQVLISSAGLDAQPGWGLPPEFMNQIELRYGLNLKGHRSQPITAELFYQADLVLAMESKQLMRLASQFPRYTKKLRLFAEMGHQGFSVPDPANLPIEGALEVMQQLYTIVESGAETFIEWLAISRK